MGIKITISTSYVKWNFYLWYSCVFELPWLKETTKPAGPFGTMSHKPWYSGKGAKPDCIIQLSCREVHTHASFKTIRTWKKFNIRGTKMSLLLDKLWLTANNSKSFANRSKSVIRRNLNLCKHSEIYLIWYFQKHYLESNGVEI